MSCLKGKTALVTGGSRGIGKAVAYLVGDGDHITGQQLNINGGIYM